MKPLEQKVIQDFGCQKFIYCSDTGLGSESIRTYNHMGERAFIVTQSVKKLPAKDKTWALDKGGFRRLSDGKPVNISEIPKNDTNLYYKDEPYMPQKLQQRLIITYSPKSKTSSTRTKLLARNNTTAYMRSALIYWMMK